MGRFADRVRGGDPAEIATHGLGGLEGGKLAAILSLFALLMSAYSLWETSLKQADVQIFVPPVIQYSAPYQNSNFEMIAVPVTLTNEGARTATVLSMELAVTDPRTKQTKASMPPTSAAGRWSGPVPAPMSRSRRSRLRAARAAPSWCCSTRAATTRSQAQLIEAVGPYTFELIFDVAESRSKPTVKFDRSLLYYDARAFNERTLPMYSADWQSSSNAKRE